MATRQRETNHGDDRVVRFTPLFNDAFLQIFGRADSRQVTTSLLNAILRKVGLPEVEQVDRIIADTSLPGGLECKTPRLDIVIISDDGRVFDLEAERRLVDVSNKSLFYAAKLLVEAMPKGSDDDYSVTPQVVVIVLLEGRVMFPGTERFLNVCRMRWDYGESDGPDRMLLVVAELDKVRASYNEETIEDVLADESLAWLYLLAAGYESQEAVERIMESFPSIEEFAKRYGIAISDPDLKRAYDKYYESILEYNTMVKQYKQLGYEEGEKEGREKGRKEGFDYGYSDGFNNGFDDGFDNGFDNGCEKALTASVAKLREAGFEDAAELLEASR